MYRMHMKIPMPKITMGAKAEITVIPTGTHAIIILSPFV